MKKILSILFLSISLVFQAQLDTEHWFAPMFDRNSINSYFSSSSRQYLFLSTNETTPFDVEIYSGNTLLTTVKNLKKGSPKYFSVANRHIISKNFQDLGKKGTMGLYVKGPKKFFANLRFSTYNHAEILTSKGLAGIGTKFYAVVAPISRDGDNINFMVSVLATENNTKVKISGYKPDVVLTNISPTPTSIEITLNKGESYIIEGDSRDANKKGFIGAKIESNKPISVTNGNFNGQYVTRGAVDGTDIIMDQSVPVERLGNEFAIIKGNGNIGMGMEGALIVATEDNTEIYVNNETTPITTLNEGEHYIVNDRKFIRSGNNHYNLYVKSSKNVYLYQLLAGIDVSTATLGFNYIPPLNCFLPNQIGEIGLINEMFGEGSRGLGEYYTVPTKLNFITMRGATVNVEGMTLTSANGPFDIKGTNDWVTYSIPNVKGNINITSTRSITAGISAGSGAVGYGGYFAGFSSVVTIKRKGECIPHLTLEVEGEYDAYQWKKDGVNIPNATAKTYKPTEPGNYSVEVTSFSCTQTTAETTVLNCTVETTINENICGVKTFEPKFSNSKQGIDLSTLQIVTQPKKGRLSVDKQTGQITYIPNVGEEGDDVFSYKFCGNDKKFPDCEQVTVNVSLNKVHLTPATVSVCSVNNMGVFDLTTAKIGHQAGDIVKYYPNERDANAGTNEITQPKTYSSAQGKVYAKVTSQGGCSAITEINLKFYDTPKVNISNYNSVHCDINFDGKIEVDFSKVTSQIVNPQAGYSVKYYASQNDADNNQNELPNLWSYSNNTTVFIKVTSKEGCSVVETINFTIKDKINLITNEYTAQVCSSPNLQVNLADYLHHFTNINGVSATYYNSLDDAKNQRNPINGQVNLTQNSKFFIRLSSTTHCDNIATINFNINQAVSSTTLKDAMVCYAGTTTLDAGTGFTHYKWSTGATTQTITVGKGQYWVELISPSGCVHRQTVNVTEYDTISLTPATVSACSVNNMGVFDLTTAKIGHQAGDIVKYYPTENDANAGTNEITQPKAYSSAQGKVYAKVTSQGGCSAVTEINLKFYAKPTVNISNYNSSHCDINFDGKIEVDFSKVTSQIVNPQAGYSVKYYASQSDADNNQNALPNLWSYAQNTAVFVKVTSKEGCSIVETINFTIKDKLNLIKSKVEITLCDTDFDAITEVNLADYISQFTNENVSATYYLSLVDAQKVINAIPNNQKAKNQQKYYIRLGNAIHCDNIAEISFKINTPKKSTTLKDISICSTDTTVLEAGARFTHYKWSTGETTSNITAKVGEYWVDLTTDTGCTYRQYVKVTAVESPKINSIDIKENTATVLAEGGTLPYEYSLDGRTWQSSNVFANLQQGKKYTVWVRSKGGCEPVSQDFVIIKLVNLITPNGDGFNDVIDYSALTTKANAKFNVYDRYGALVFEGNNSNQFIWDGKAKGRPLPTASYWYLIEWQEPNTNTWVKTASWILLKNRE